MHGALVALPPHIRNVADKGFAASTGVEILIEISVFFALFCLEVHLSTLCKGAGWEQASTYDSSKTKKA